MSRDSENRSDAFDEVPELRYDSGELERLAAAVKGQSAGTGIAVMLAGLPKGQNTIAAEAVAKALNRNLYRIDLSEVVSKYIGETEKNLDRLFDRASPSESVLFFDEADALFGKRTDVKDSHDRFDTPAIDYLLQRIEAFPGTVLVTVDDAAGARIIARRLRRARRIVVR